MRSIASSCPFWRENTAPVQAKGQRWGSTSGTPRSKKHPARSRSPGAGKQLPVVQLTDAEEIHSFVREPLLELPVLPLAPVLPLDALLPSPLLVLLPKPLVDPLAPCVALPERDPVLPDNEPLDCDDPWPDWLELWLSRAMRTLFCTSFTPGTLSATSSSV